MIRTAVLAVAVFYGLKIGAAEGFTRADANKDGTVTIAELQALSRGPR